MKGKSFGWKEFWDNRGYFQKGVIIGLIFGFFVYFGFLILSLTVLSDVIPKLIGWVYAILFGLIILIGCGLLFGFISFLIKIVKKGFWKELVLTVLIIIVIVIVWKVATRPYHIKDGLCYSNFLEDCKGKKVEITGKIEKNFCKDDNDFLSKRITDSYVLCNISVTSCDTKSKRLIKFLEISEIRCYPSNVLVLFQPCMIWVDEEGKVWADEGCKEIDYEVEKLLPDPEGKTVKIVGKVSVHEIPSFTAAGHRSIVGIIPDSITVIKGES